MPFTTEAFFAVFEQYNNAIGPAPIVAYAAGLLVVVLLFVGGRRAGVLVTSVLAAMWLVNAAGYHWMFFSQINPAARAFAVLFAIEAAALAVSSAVFRDLRYSIGRDLRSIAGLSLIVFAMAVYPLWGWLAGHDYPAMPIFGVAPCPTTIFTIGVLLTGTWRAVRWLLVIPVLWSAIGGSAALLLGVPQDYGLLATLVVAVAVALGHWRGRQFALHAGEDGAA